MYSLVDEVKIDWFDNCVMVSHWRQRQRRRLANSCVRESNFCPRKCSRSTIFRVVRCNGQFVYRHLISICKSVQFLNELKCSTIENSLLKFHCGLGTNEKHSIASKIQRRSGFLSLNVNRRMRRFLKCCDVIHTKQCSVECNWQSWKHKKIQWKKKQTKKKKKHRNWLVQIREPKKWNKKSIHVSQYFHWCFKFYLLK